jgi:chromosomal replication initiation ATPase DnaA
MKQILIDEIYLQELLALIGKLCPDCQAQVRLLTSTQLDNRVASDVTTERIYPIIALVAEERKLHVDDIISSSQHVDLVDARREISIRARARKFTFPAIGRALHRHHTTIVHLVNTGREQIAR